MQQEVDTMQDFQSRAASLYAHGSIDRCNSKLGDSKLGDSGLGDDTPTMTTGQYKTSSLTAPRELIIEFIVESFDFPNSESFLGKGEKLPIPCRTLAKCGLSPRSHHSVVAPLFACFSAWMIKHSRFRE